jgi:hypothetical protein
MDSRPSPNRPPTNAAGNLLTLTPVANRRRGNEESLILSFTMSQPPSESMSRSPRRVSALRTEEYFANRAVKGDVKKALQVLRRAGKGNPPVPGDELPVKTSFRRR